MESRPHLAVAACYLIEYPDEDVAGHMRRGIVHYNHCVGTVNSDRSGYHANPGSRPT
ncbi:MAG TPA: hypothetical protein VNY30_03295 [Bryobacteraceae bacterium]|nr:hypothetical protein [Bryobacteraceae bacterium]